MFVAMATLLSVALSAKVLHLTDIHLDTLSDPTQFGPDTFCRSDDNLPDAEHLARTARYWAEDFKYTARAPRKQTARSSSSSSSPSTPFGQYLCDTTPALLNSVLSSAFAASYDFVVITGDFAAHNQPNKSTTLYMFEHAVSAVANANSNGVPIVPVLGNEDFYPDYGMDCNSRDGRDHLWDLWSALSQAGWIPSSQDQAFKQFGGLHVDVLQQNLRVISLNTIIWSQRNDHSDDHDDPCGQFNWFQNALGDAQSNGQRVWLAGHIPPSFNLWRDKYLGTFLQLVQQYASIIDLTLWGHTHSNSFFVSDAVPSLVGLISGSVTPNPVNPSVRVLNVTTKSSGSIVATDFVQTYVDLHAINANGNFAEQPLFTFSRTFGAPVSSAAIRSLHNKLVSSAAFRSTYFPLEVSLYDNAAFDRVCGQFVNATEYWACRVDLTM